LISTPFAGRPSVNIAMKKGSLIREIYNSGSLIREIYNSQIMQQPYSSGLQIVIDPSRVYSSPIIYGV
jgi:hypothetical protein